MGLETLQEAPVFLHYTKAELDRNFDQRGWIPNAVEIIARHVERSRRTREKLTFISDLRYGPHPDELLDYFPAVQNNAPVHIFVHGDAWKNFTKNDYSFPAESYVAAGFHTAILNFSKLPTVRLPEMVDQVRRGVAWVYKNAAQYGGDPHRLSMSAHSSGAHLTANALITDWAAFGCPPDIVKAAACVSGPYDLEPVMLSARSSYVELNKTEVAALSVHRHLIAFCARWQLHMRMAIPTNSSVKAGSSRARSNGAAFLPRARVSQGAITSRSWKNSANPGASSFSISLPTSDQWRHDELARGRRLAHPSAKVAPFEAPPTRTSRKPRS